MKHSEINWAALLNFLNAQIGKPYVFGVENNPDEKDLAKYRAWDCSEIVEVGFHKIGITVPDGSYNQAKMCKRLTGTPSKLLIGDLGFKWDPETEAIHHVGIYIGADEVVEAKGRQWGVVVTTIEDYTKSTHFAWWGRLKTIEDA